MGCRGEKENSIIAGLTGARAFVQASEPCVPVPPAIRFARGLFCVIWTTHSAVGNNTPWGFGGLALPVEYTAHCPFCIHALAGRISVYVYTRIVSEHVIVAEVALVFAIT